MSQESAQAFVEKMRSDEAFSAKVMAAEDGAARTAIIRAEGFDCSADEIEAVSAELGEHELRAVVGGTNATVGLFNDTIGR